MPQHAGAPGKPRAKGGPRNGRIQHVHLLVHVRRGEKVPTYFQKSERQPRMDTDGHGWEKQKAETKPRPLRTTTDGRRWTQILEAEVRSCSALIWDAVCRGFVTMSRSARLIIRVRRGLLTLAFRQASGSLSS